MSRKKEQHRVGAPEEPRGQETGQTGEMDQDRRAKMDTPSLRGRRKGASKMFSDDSSQHTGADAATPRSNTPSLPAAIPTGEPLGQTGGEKSFKQRHSKAKKSKA